VSHPNNKAYLHTGLYEKARRIPCVFRIFEWAKVQIHEEADCRATQSSHATEKQELLSEFPRWCDHLLDLHRHGFSIGDADPGQLGTAAKYSKWLEGALGS
jgi:hypothetical protein